MCMAIWFLAQWALVFMVLKELGLLFGQHVAIGELEGQSQLVFFGDGPKNTMRGFPIYWWHMAKTFAGGQGYGNVIHPCSIECKKDILQVGVAKVKTPNIGGAKDSVLVDGPTYLGQVHVEGRCWAHCMGYMSIGLGCDLQEEALFFRARSMQEGSGVFHSLDDYPMFRILGSWCEHTSGKVGLYVLMVAQEGMRHCCSQLVKESLATPVQVCSP